MDNEDELDEFVLGVSLISCMVKLTRDEGVAIKSLINENYPHTYPFYCRRVGISTPNFYSTLNGERQCSLEFLNKLLSGISYRAIILNPTIVIQEIPTGQIVDVADFITPDTESLSNEQEEVDM